ncbi:MAG: GTPase, partial [bacterium]|nr:GTPase [bacterium]
IMADVLTELNRLGLSTRAGRIAKEGVSVVIVGRPNAGKSSLLNALAGEDKAIVTEVAGTTRDPVQVSLNLGGVLVSVVDTAGMRESTDLVEALGIAKAETALQKADIVLLLIDRSAPLTDEDTILLQKTKDKPRILVYSKADLPGDLILEGNFPALNVSSHSGQGLDGLKEQLALYAKELLGPENSLLLTNLRHSELIARALDALGKADDACREGWELDLVLIDVRRTYDLLGEIIGEAVSDDMASAIFSRFCIGK